MKGVLKDRKKRILKEFYLRISRIREKLPADLKALSEYSKHHTYKQFCEMEAN